MFLHIGNDTVVPVGDIIAICDYRIFCSGPNLEWLEFMRERDAVQDAGGATKSLIVADGMAYLSAIAPHTLKQRADRPWTAKQS